MKGEINGYELLEEIHRGPLTTVYRARQKALNRPVLIKILHPHLSEETDVVERFRREAEACARISHPNIVSVFTFGTFEDRPFLAMEYVEGVTLQNLLGQHRVLPIGMALYIAREILKGLSHAHNNGVIHRDVKPSNILISQDGAVKLTDFGLAALEGVPTLTAPGAALGTPAYMAPEQVKGEKITKQVDLFSLGATLYEMLSGERPFEGETPGECLHRVLNVDPPPLIKRNPHIPPRLSHIVQRLLAKSPRRRYRDTAHVLKELEQLAVAENLELSPEKFKEHLAALEGKAPVGKEPPEVPKPHRIFRRPIRVGAAISAVLLLAILVVSYPYLKRSLFEKPPPLSADEEILEPAAPAVKEEPEERPGSAPELEPPIAPEDTGEPRRPQVMEIPPSSESTEKITRADQKTVPSTTEADSGYLWIACLPWAKIHIDGRYVDDTPLHQPLVLPPGEHQLALENPHFPLYSITVHVRSGQKDTLQVNLWETVGQLRIEVIPWAKVFIDGQYRDTTPLSKPLILTPGVHTLVLKNPGFPEWRGDIAIRAGETKTLKISLLNQPK